MNHLRFGLPGVIGRSETIKRIAEEKGLQILQIPMERSKITTERPSVGDVDYEEKMGNFVSAILSNINEDFLGMPTPTKNNKNHS